MTVQALKIEGDRPLARRAPPSVRGRLARTTARADLPRRPMARSRAGSNTGHSGLPSIPWGEETFEDLDNLALCQRLRHRDVPLPRRTEILEEMALRGSNAHEHLFRELFADLLDDLAPLGDPESSQSAWLSMLLGETVRLQTTDMATRDSLARTLLDLSLHWLWTHGGSGESPLLWATLRRAASLLRPEDTSRLVAFMADDLPLSIHQVTLQAVEETAAMLDHSLPAPVVSAVEALAQHYVRLASTRQGGADIDAVAGGAVASALLARAPAAPRLLLDVVDACPPRVRWLAGVILSRALDHRARTRPGALEIPAVAEALTALRGNGEPRDG